MCPYCNATIWRNSWGHGNAICVECDREFIIQWINGQPVGVPLTDRADKITPRPTDSYAQLSDGDEQ